MLIILVPQCPQITIKLSVKCKYLTFIFIFYNIGICLQGRLEEDTLHLTAELFSEIFLQENMSEH